jgi:dihydropteroate synthase
MNVLSCRGRLLDLSRPVVMGILNVTPDSFYDGGKYTEQDAWLQQTEKMLEQGAAIIDIGGASSRPGAIEVDTAEEIRRVTEAVETIVRHFPETLISVDTWRAAVAKVGVEAGASIVNDISAGRFDPHLYETVAALGTPYILMHMRGTPGHMPTTPASEDIVTEVLDFFITELLRLRSLGIKDIVLDPGFGFGKSRTDNYKLLKNLHVFRQVTGLPVLAGPSRKSMIYKYLDINSEEALPATTALNLVALQQGASILRVHDVREAVQAVKLWEMMNDE